MGLLTGSVSITRFNIRHRPPEIEFDDARFTEIPPGSELRESKGFVPFELGAPYEVGASRWAFRVRIDRLRPDPTAVKERLQELIRGELEGGAAFVGSKKRKELRDLAEEELIIGTSPSTKIIEGVIDGDLLYVGSTAKAYLGIVMQLLRQIGIIVELKTPWGDRGQEDLESPLIDSQEPGESVWGCRFLRCLMADRELMIEPESGYVRLQTEETRVVVTGAVRKDLRHYLDQNAELLTAKLLTGETSFRFEGMSFRISSLRVEAGRHEHWTELLDERLEKINDVWELVERKYDEHRSEMV